MTLTLDKFNDLKEKLAEAAHYHDMVSTALPTHYPHADWCTAIRTAIAELEKGEKEHEASVEVMAAYAAFIKLLSVECDGSASVHGWRSQLFEAGKQARKRIEAALASFTALQEKPRA